MHGAEAGEVRGADVGVIREQEEAARAGPEPVEGGVGLEDVRGRRARSCRYQGPLIQPLTRWTGWRV